MTKELFNFLDSYFFALFPLPDWFRLCFFNTKIVIQPIMYKAILQKKNIIQIFIGFVFIIVITSFEVNARETEDWGHRAPSPAIVNPVVRSSYQQFISLSGEWEFTVQSPYEASRRLDHYLMIPDAKWPNSRTIKVPSCWEAQGIGEPGMSKPWDITYDNCQKPLKHIYMGYGWYRKTFSIPEKWKEQKI